MALRMESTGVRRVAAFLGRLPLLCRTAGAAALILVLGLAVLDLIGGAGWGWVVVAFVPLVFGSLVIFASGSLGLIVSGRKAAWIDVLIGTALQICAWIAYFVVVGQIR